MSKITNSRKIPLEEFKDQKSWISKLLSPLNTLLQDLILILNNGIVLDDNLKSQEYRIRLVADGVRTNSSFSWKWDKNQAPTAVIVSQLIEEGSATVPATGFTWQYSGSAITCNINGLTASKSYQVVVRGFA